MTRQVRTAVSEVGSTTVCRVEGDLDAYQAPLVRDQFAHLGGRTSVAIDLTAVPVIDSCGLGVLIRWIGQFRSAGSEVSLRVRPGMTARLVRAAGLDRLVVVAVHGGRTGSGIRVPRRLPEPQGSWERQPA